MKRFAIIYVLLMLLIGSLTAIAQWQYLPAPNIYYPCFHVASYNGKLFVASNDNIYESTDGGNSWNNLTQGFINNAGNSNRFLAFAGDNIFVGTTVENVYMSPDNGTTWQRDSTGLSGSNQIDAMFSDGTIIFVSLNWPDYGFYKKGATPGVWGRINSSSIGTDYNSQVLGIANIGATYYAATRAQGLFESTDGGNTWTAKGNSAYPSGNINGSGASQTLVAHGQKLFLSTTDGVFMSDDLGDNWSRVDQGFARWCITPTLCSTPIYALYSDGTNIYASVNQNDSAYVSLDNGTTWQDISDGDLSKWITSFAVHNNDLYATIWWSGSNTSTILKYTGLTGIEEEPEANIAHHYYLEQNFPNPFNPVTNVEYGLRTAEWVTLTVYDLLGRELKTLVDGIVPPGSHTVQWDGRTNTGQLVASGVYYYRLQVGQKYAATRKMLMLR